METSTDKLVAAQSIYATRNAENLALHPRIAAMLRCGSILTSDVTNKWKININRNILRALTLI